MHLSLFYKCIHLWLRLHFPIFPAKIQIDLQLQSFYSIQGMQQTSYSLGAARRRIRKLRWKGRQILMADRENSELVHLFHLMLLLLRRNVGLFL